MKLLLTMLTSVSFFNAMQAITVQEMQAFFYENKPTKLFDLNNQEILDILVKNSPLEDSQETTPLDIAIQINSPWAATLLNENDELHAQIRVVKQQLQEGKLTDYRILLHPHNIINTPLDTAGNTAIHFAVLKKDFQLIKWLCENGANPNKHNGASDLPFTFALRGAIDVNLVALLLEYIDPKARSSYGNTFAHLLAYYQDPNAQKVLDMLAEKGMPVSETTAYEETPLHGAVQKKNVGMVIKLRNHDANINAQNGGGRTPLHHAAESGCKEVIDELLKFNTIDYSIVDDNGKKPSDIAANQWIADYLRSYNL